MFIMKESEVDWIKRIPTHWNTNKCKYISLFINGYSFDSKKLISDYIFPVIRIGDINGGKINYSSILGVKSNNGLQQYKTQPNDILLAMSGATVGKIGLVNIDDKASYINQRVGIIRSKFSKYLFYCLSTNSFIEYILLNALGSAQPNVSTNIFNNFKIPFPSLIEQHKIADFLDQKCSEIDALTADIQTQIETLEEYKKSVITEAVTKGLDPNVEMKDSGVEWIGKIPKSWPVIRLKYSSWLKGRIGWQGLRTDEFIEDEQKPYLITGTDFDNGYINWNTCVHISEERYMQDLAIHIKENDLLITKDGTIGKVAVAKNCPEKVSLNSGVFIIRNTRNYKYNDRYMYYLIQSEQFCKWFELSNSGNSTIRHLNQEKFYNFAFTYPSITEQTKIADSLDKKCSEIDMTISEKQQQLETLAEYKKSLIYEYVTGKKEVA